MGVGGGRILCFMWEHLPVSVNYVDVAFHFRWATVQERWKEFLPTRTVKSTWRFLLLLQAGLTYIKEAIPMLISFLPLPSKHLHQYTSTIIPDIFGSLRICLSANISQQIYQKNHLHPAIPNLYFSLIMNPSSSRYVPHTSSQVYQVVVANSFTHSASTSQPNPAKAPLCRSCKKL